MHLFLLRLTGLPVLSVGVAQPSLCRHCFIEDLASIKAALPAIPGPCPINLVHSHSRRMHLNYELQKWYAPSGAVMLDASSVRIGSSESQSILLYPGLKLLSVVNTLGLRNMWTYEVDSVDMLVQMHDERGVYEIPLEKMTELFRLSFARTYFAAQGLTFERVRLWDDSNPFFTRQHLITGLSRCTTASSVDFGHY